MHNWKLLNINDLQLSETNKIKNLGTIWGQLANIRPKTARPCNTSRTAGKQGRRTAEQQNSRKAGKRDSRKAGPTVFPLPAGVFTTANTMTATMPNTTTATITAPMPNVMSTMPTTTTANTTSTMPNITATLTAQKKAASKTDR